MPSCCVPFCRSRPTKGSGIPFHEFPIDKELREKWLKCISREGTSKGSQFIPNDKSNSSLVCGLHFKDGDYRFSFNGDRTNKLNKNAFPTRFLNYSELAHISKTDDRKDTTKVYKRKAKKTASRFCDGRKRAIIFSNGMDTTIKKEPIETLHSNNLEESPSPVDTSDHHTEL